jgi:hypothetical protein
MEPATIDRVLTDLWHRRCESLGSGEALVPRTIGFFAVLFGSAAAGWWWVRQSTMEYNARQFGNAHRGTVIFSNTPTVGEAELTRIEG